MAGWNGSGTFTLPYTWTADAAAGIPIMASRMDTQEATISSQGFGNTLTRDGQGQPTANLPMAGFRHTGAAAAVGDNDYVIKSQITGATLAGSFTTVTTSGTVSVGTTLTVANSATITAGGLRVTAGGFVVTAGGGTITAGGLVVAAGGAGIAGGLTVQDTGLVVTAGTIALSPTTGNVAISPVAGSLVINPGTAGGTMNNVVIGGTTPAAGTFTALVANNGTTGTQVVNYSQFGATTGNPTTLTFPGGGAFVGGGGVSSTGGTVTISYGVTFAAAPIIVCTLTGSATDAYQIAVQSTGTADFVAFATLSGAGQSGVGFNWQAIGKV